MKIRKDGVEEEKKKKEEKEGKRGGGKLQLQYSQLTRLKSTHSLDVHSQGEGEDMIEA